MVQSGDAGVIVILLEGGTDPSVPKQAGLSLLHWAAIFGQDAVVNLLLENGVDINIRSNTGGTALHAAVEYQQEAMVKSLLERGVNVDLLDDEGKTALNEIPTPGPLTLSQEVIVGMLCHQIMICLEEQLWGGDDEGARVGRVMVFQT